MPALSIRFLPRRRGAMMRRGPVPGKAMDVSRLIADTPISGARVGRELDAAVFERMARPPYDRQR